MKQFVLLGILFSSPLLLAETIKSRVHSVEGKIIKFENGRVAFLDKQQPELDARDYVEAKIDDRSSLVSIKKLTPPQEKMSFTTEINSRPDFEPTVLPNMEEAMNIFNRSNPDYKRISECSDRAHVWSYEEFKKTGTKSMKAFVFFSADYITAFRFKWWFHVAPMYKVNNNGTIQDLVMDFRYTDRPMAVKEWTDNFVYTKRDCKITKKFSDYEAVPQSESCWLIFETMHYKLPFEIYDQELKGKYKAEIPDAEIKDSYRFAFQ
jgi:hypothetical protein